MWLGVKGSWGESQEEKDQEGPGANFYLKRNLNRGQILMIFIHPIPKCKERDRFLVSFIPFPSAKKQQFISHICLLLPF